MLECVGDSTIEAPWTKTDKTTGVMIDHGIDGAGIKHKCRDISHLRAIAEQTEQRPAHVWDYKPGDTIELVFGEL